MVRVDVPKVRGKMAEKGLTKTSMAEKLGVNRSTVAIYLKHPEKMPYHIVAQMAEMLCDSGEEAEAIFFAQDLRKK